MESSDLSNIGSDIPDETTTRRNSFDSSDSIDTHFMGGKSISHDNSRSEICSDIVDELIANDSNSPSFTKESKPEIH